MRNISELNLLLREQAELPVGLKVVTEEFREGWSFVRTTNAKRLGKKIQTCGWNFIKIADGSLRSGIGETSQQAIAGALKLALRRVSELFTAVEVGKIDVTRYPWFILARVRVYPYLIQEGTRLPSEVALPPIARELVPHSSSAIHQAKLFWSYRNARGNGPNDSSGDSALLESPS